MDTSSMIAGLALPLLLSAQQEPGDWLHLAERDWGDLPATALDKPIPAEKGYLGREIAPNVHMVTDGLYQAMFIITPTGVVVVDAPPTIGPKLLTAIAETSSAPVTHLIYSHSHSDHIGAADLFGKNVVRVASKDVADKLARLGDPRRPVPTLVIGKPRTTLEVEGMTVILDQAGNRHEPGNLYVFLPKERVLMVVDVIYPGWVPFTNLGMAEGVQGFIDAHDEILGYDFDVMVAGHLSRPGNRADVEIARSYVQDLVSSADLARSQVEFGRFIQEYGFANRWLLVKSYMDEVSRICTTSMLERWRDKLAGAAVSTPGHCWLMQEHLNINGLPAGSKSVPGD